MWRWAATGCVLLATGNACGPCDPAPVEVGVPPDDLASMEAASPLPMDAARDHRTVTPDLARPDAALAAEDLHVAADLRAEDLRAGDLRAGDGALIDAGPPDLASPAFPPCANFVRGKIVPGVVSWWEPALADLNGDGLLDVATVDGEGKTLWILKGMGGGALAAPASIQLGVVAHYVQAGDLNGDGITDLVTAGDTVISGPVAVLLGKGQGVFGAPKILGGDAYPRLGRLVDITGDGKVDIITANSRYLAPPSGATVSIFPGDGYGNFGARRDFSLGSREGGVTVADLNGDGRPDVAAPTFDGFQESSVRIVLNQGMGALAAPQRFPAGWGVYDIAAGDTNADGRVDLVVRSNHGVLAFLGDGKGGFGAYRSFPAPWGPGMAVADLDQDGKLDVITGGGSLLENEPSAVLYGKGDGTFDSPRNCSIAGTAGTPLIGDINLDKKPDIVLAGRDGLTLGVLPLLGK